MKIKASDLVKVRDAILRAGGYQCPLCLHPLRPSGTKKKPVVDHDHATGYIRDVLCVNCNGMEGKIFNAARRAAGKGEDVQLWLIRLIQYYNDHKKPAWANDTRPGLIYPAFKTKNEKRRAKLAKTKRTRLANKLVKGA